MLHFLDCRVCACMQVSKKLDSTLLKHEMLLWYVTIICQRLCGKNEVKKILIKKIEELTSNLSLKAFQGFLFNNLHLKLLCLMSDADTTQGWNGQERWQVRSSTNGSATRAAYVTTRSALPTNCWISSSSLWSTTSTTSLSSSSTTSLPSSRLSACWLSTHGLSCLWLSTSWLSEVSISGIKRNLEMSLSTVAWTECVFCIDSLVDGNRNWTCVLRFSVDSLNWWKHPSASCSKVLLVFEFELLPWCVQFTVFSWCLNL